MTDLQKQIEELQNYIEYKPDESLGDSLAAKAFNSGVESGIVQIKKALSIISQLEHQLQHYKNCYIEFEAIIAEQEEEIKGLKKQYEGALTLAANLQTKLDKNNDK